MIIQVSVQGDTLTVTESINTALAVCRDHISQNPPVTEILEIDVWDQIGMIDASYGFTPRDEALSRIESWLNEQETE